MRMHWAGSIFRWMAAAMAVALACCWLTMIWVGLRWEGKVLKTYYSCDLARGALSIEYYDEDQSSTMSGSDWRILKRVSPMNWKPVWKPPGYTRPTRVWMIVPLWMPFLAASAVAGAPWGLLVRWRRRRKGRCAACGYDLRGLAPDARCPECAESEKAARIVGRVRRRRLLVALKLSFIGMAAASAVLGAVTSHWFIEWRTKDLARDTGVLVWKGMVDIEWGPAVPGFYLWVPQPGFSMGTTRSPFPMEPCRWQPRWSSGPYGSGVSVPLWLPVLVSAGGFASVSGAERFVRRRRRRLGLCRLCGYDRRGLAPDGVCPECGAGPA